MIIISFHAFGLSALTTEIVVTAQYITVIVVIYYSPFILHSCHSGSDLNTNYSEPARESWSSESSVTSGAMN